MLKADSDPNLSPSQIRSHKPPGFLQVFLKLVLSNPDISPRVLADCDLLEVPQKMEVAKGSEGLEVYVEHRDTVWYITLSTNRVTASDSWPIISFICKELVFFSPWLPTRTKFVQHRLLQLLKGANRKSFFFINYPHNHWYCNRTLSRVDYLKYQWSFNYSTFKEIIL